MMILGWLTFLPQPEALLPLHEAHRPLAQADPFSLFARVFAYASRTWIYTSDHFTDESTFCRQNQSMRHGLETINANDA